MCLFCGGTHNYTKCENKDKTLACTDCKYSNTKLNTNYEINHSPNDTENCMFLKNKIKLYITDMEYPTTPEVPKYLGKIVKNKKENKDN